MNYFDSLINGYFKRGVGGETIFFPYQRTGYILTPEEEAKVRAFLKDWYKNVFGCFFALYMLCALLGLFKYRFIYLIVISVFCIFDAFFYYFTIKRLISNAQKAQEKFSYREAAIARGLPKSILRAVFGFLLIGVGMYWFIASPSLADKFTAAFATLFFGYILILNMFFVKHCVSSKKERRNNTSPAPK